jgi:hypothetical protein
MGIVAGGCATSLFGNSLLANIVPAKHFEMDLVMTVGKLCNNIKL